MNISHRAQSELQHATHSGPVTASPPPPRRPVGIAEYNLLFWEMFTAAITADIRSHEMLMPGVSEENTGYIKELVMSGEY